jgi:hypothetical protein
MIRTSRVRGALRVARTRFGARMLTSLRLRARSGELRGRSIGAEPRGAVAAHHALWAAALGQDVYRQGSKGGRARLSIVLLGALTPAQVIFDKLSPHETLFLDPSAEVRVKLAASNLLVRYQTLDFPGGYDFDRSAKIDPQRLFRHYPTIPNEKQVAAVFVIDAQDTDSFGEAIEYMARIVNTIYAVNRNASFDVFIHKVSARGASAPWSARPLC